MKKFRILMLHNHYRIRGGEDESTLLEAELLRQAGHRVTLLTDRSTDISNSMSKVSAGVSAIWSQQWHLKVLREITENQYDILHVQNFYPKISPSVYYAAKSAGLKVIQAVRNYRMMCVSANLFRNGRVCEDCVGSRFKYKGILRGCYNDSVAQSAMVAGLNFVHRSAGTWQRKVDAYIAVSEFVKDRLLAEGIPAKRVHVKPNFVPEQGNIQDFHDTHERRNLLFVGRLTAEKGLSSLAEAWQIANLQEKLLIIGEGALDTVPVRGMEYLGRLNQDRVSAQMLEARAVVMPGVWPEPFGRVAVEAFAQATPVIATSIGGVASIVQHEQNGLLVPPGNPALLAEAIASLVTRPGYARELGAGARCSYLALYTPAANLERLEEIYHTVSLS